MSWCPDSQRILTASGDKTCRLWDVGTAQMIRLEETRREGKGAVYMVLSSSMSSKWVATSKTSRWRACGRENGCSWCLCLAVSTTLTINSTYGADASVLVQMSTESAQTTCIYYTPAGRQTPSCTNL